MILPTQASIFKFVHCQTFPSHLIIKVSPSSGKNRATQQDQYENNPPTPFRLPKAHPLTVPHTPPISLCKSLSLPIRRGDATYRLPINRIPFHVHPRSIITPNSFPSNDDHQKKKKRHPLFSDNPKRHTGRTDQPTERKEKLRRAHRRRPAPRQVLLRRSFPSINDVDDPSGVLFSPTSAGDYYNIEYIPSVREATSGGELKVNVMYLTRERVQRVRGQLEIHRRSILRSATAARGRQD